MDPGIKRNNINNSTDDNIILQYLKDFKAVKCLYCFQDEPKFLCLCEECGYYFCNNIHRRTSHIVIHLKQCKHKRVALYPFKNENELACEKCRAKDVFSLCFKEKQILCDSCVEEIEEEENFERVVEEKNFNNKILMSPEIPPVANRFDSYSESLITRINNKILKIRELKIETTVSLNNSDKKNYCIKYINLLQTEEAQIEKENEEEEFFEFKLKFFDEDGYITAEIKREQQKFLFYHRQLLIVAKADNPHKYELAKVINVDNTKNTIKIYFKDLKQTKYDGVYKIKEKESTESITRMINGLENLKKENSNLFDNNILELIIGNEHEEENKNFTNENDYLDKSKIPKRFNLSQFENNQLNESQENAIRNCFKNKLTLIKGPPGTGKTKVLSILAFYLEKLRKSFNDKIFIGAPSNRAVDNISFYLQKLELPFVRVLSSEKEGTEDVDKTNSLEVLVSKEIEKNQNSKKFKELSEKKLKYGKLKEEDFIKYSGIVEELQKKILDSCPIIIATINNSADIRISSYNFPIVLLDEATQALEPDCLLPLYHNAKMVVMIGDEKQLGPTVKSLEATIAGLDISLFERLCYYYKGSNFISTLNEQYRMHKSLYEFSNKHFYDDKIITFGEIELNEEVKNNFPWPNKEIPTFLYHNVEPENRENNSYYNEKEMYYIYGIVHKLEKAGVKLNDIGIITPYNAQKLKLQFEKFNKEKFDDLKIESVDGFQGMEKEYIIISTVRSNKFGHIGFLKSPKRLNVSLTRARKGLIIVGNAECLAKRNGIWRDLIKYYYSKKLIVQGPLSELKPVSEEELPIPEIDEGEELEEDNEDLEDTKMDKYLNLDKKTSSEMRWGTPPPPVEDDSWDITEKKEKKEENEIIGLDNKKKKKKNPKKTNNGEEEGEEEEYQEKKEGNKGKNKKEKKEKDKTKEIEDEKEDKKTKKPEKKQNDEDNKENTKGKKGNKKKGKK